MGASISMTAGKARWRKVPGMPPTMAKTVATATRTGAGWGFHALGGPATKVRRELGSRAWK